MIKKTAIALALLLMLYTMAGCSAAPQSTLSQDSIASQNITLDDFWWQVTKIEAGVGASHFFITVKNGKIGCVIDVTRIDEYILYDVGDLIRGDFVATTTAAGTFTFAETGHTYDTLGHLVFSENDTIDTP